MDNKIKNIKLINSRRREGLTQLEVAEKAKVAIRAYQNYEAGGRIPNAHIAGRIARVLKSTVEELFGSATSTMEKEA